MKRYALLFVNVVTRVFTGLTFAVALILTVGSHIAGHTAMEFSEIHIIKIFVFAVVLGVITVIRESLENKKWMLRLSFIQKRWIFFPLYLAVTLLFIYDYGLFETFGLKEIALHSAYFLVIAGTVTAIMSKRYKSETQSLTESVAEYKNKLGEK